MTPPRIRRNDVTESRVTPTILMLESNCTSSHMKIRGAFARRRLSAISRRRFKLERRRTNAKSSPESKLGEYALTFHVLF